MLCRESQTGLSSAILVRFREAMLLLQVLQSLRRLFRSARTLTVLESLDNDIPHGIGIQRVNPGF